MSKRKRNYFLASLTLLFGAALLTQTVARAQDYQGAMAVWRQQAVQGNAEAQTSLGDFYLNGWGVAKDPAAAMKWYIMAANQKYSDAQFNIGQMYDEGNGVKQDVVQAYEWYTLAAANSEPNTSATGRRTLLVARMTPDQITEGKRLASEWKPAPASPSTPGAVPDESGAAPTCTPSPSDYQALALSPSKLMPGAFSALTLAQQKMVCSTRAFNQQVALQKGVMDKMKIYSTKYLSPAENDRMDAASNDFMQRLMKSKGF